MTRLSPDALIESLNWRYATKKFDPAKKLDAATWKALEEALCSAPPPTGCSPGSSSS